MDGGVHHVSATVTQGTTMLRLRCLAVCWVSCALLGSVLLFGFPLTASGVTKKSWLISPAESESLGKDNIRQHGPYPGSNAVLMDTTSQGGPTLQVDEPQGNLVHSPIAMRIRFIQKAAPVDMSSLEVHAQKWVLGAFHGNLDLSPRIKNFLIANGIDMKNQDIPKGRYRFVLAIKDTEGARTEGMLLLDVE